MNSRTLLAQQPSEKITLNVAVSNITTAAWVEITAATTMPCDAMIIDNTTDDILQISTGAAGAEANSILPIYIKPCEESQLIPLPVGRGKRLSVKAVNHSVTYGDIIINTFK